MARVDVSQLDLGKMVAVGTRFYAHLTGAHVVALTVLGDRLGLFEKLADDGPMTSTELAESLSLNERYVREWANALVATSYLEVDDTGRYWMTNEIIFQLGDPDSPGFAAGVYQLALGVTGNVSRLTELFRTGGGFGYDEIGEEVTVGVERTWAPIHEHFLPLWLEGIPGLAAKLRSGAQILDIGCGRGRSTISLARTFPESTVLGIDADPASIDAARELASSRGVTANIAFAVRRAEEITVERAYDFAYLFHTVHDIPDPVPALAAVRRALTEDGILLCVESAASGDPMRNRGTPAELFSSISPLFNLPVALAGAADGSGTIVTDEDMRQLADKAEFGSFETIGITDPPPSMLHHFHVMRR